MHTPRRVAFDPRRIDNVARPARHARNGRGQRSRVCSDVICDVTGSEVKDGRMDRPATLKALIKRCKSEGPEIIYDARLVAATTLLSNLRCVTVMCEMKSFYKFNTLTCVVFKFLKNSS